MATAAVFMSGNSQAVRLPKSFKLNAKRVHIERRGNEIVLKELPGTMAEFLNKLQALTPEESDEWDRIMAQVQDPPSQSRDWQDLLDSMPAKSAVKK